MTAFCQVLVLNRVLFFALLVRCFVHLYGLKHCVFCPYHSQIGRIWLGSYVLRGVMAVKEHGVVSCGTISSYSHLQILSCLTLALIHATAF